jgi:dihydrofolate synthase/folylpolyglutamate synthase
MNYTQTLDLIFQSYLAAKPLIAGKFDRDVRNPQIILDVAAQLDLLPPADRVLKVTGSKGKGTVARLCAEALRLFGKVGLLVSPEEITHLDRMRIDGQAISEDDFITSFEAVWQAVPALEAPQYLSPYGLFLLVALHWFKQQGVDYFVLETGRGVKFDEGGQLAAKLGVVTSVFLEHPTYLGPSLGQIAADKLSIVESCADILVADTQMPVGETAPGWYQKSQGVAQQAVQQFIGQAVDLPDAPCASFGQRQLEDCTLYYEGMIAPESADRAFLSRLIDRYDGSVCFYISLPDDKDFQGVCEILEELSCDNRHIIMTGERGFLSYGQARTKTLAYEGPYDDVAALQTGLNFEDHRACYFIGTQTFLRLVKQAYFL